MKKIIGYVNRYAAEADKRIFILSSLFIALFIFCNYHFGLNDRITRLPFLQEYASWYFIFLLAFSIPYILLSAWHQRQVFQNKSFLLLFFIAPALFSWKMASGLDIHFGTDKVREAYWNQVIYWPYKLVVIAGLLFILWKVTREEQPFYGVAVRDFTVSPYLLMLLIMVPLVALASTQPDFLSMYPKLKSISFLKNQHHSGWYKLLYELSYGSDFFSIELFFRGFLVLAFAKWFGKDAILPMACFYCTIHFGKPVGECISSYFGGLILGIVIYHTRTIFGGLMVHLGIAWMMELGGYLGHLYLR